MSSFQRSIENVVQTYVHEWIREVAETYELPIHALTTSWDAFVSSSSSSDEQPPTPITPPAKKCTPAYVQFCNDNRNKVKAMYPDMKFGEISKELGKMWRELSDAGRQAYTQPVHTTTDVVPTISETDLQKKTLLQLREMCVEKSLKKTGNKEILIQRLLDHFTKDALPPERDEVGGTTSSHEILTFEDDDLCGRTERRATLEEEEDDDDMSDTSDASFQFDDEEGELSLDGYN